MASSDDHGALPTAGEFATTIIHALVMPNLAAANPLDRLASSSSTSSSIPPAAIHVPLFIGACSTIAVHASCAVLDLVPWPNLACRVAADIFAGIYLLDFVSGVFHATLDYSDVGEPLRTVVRRTFEEVHETRKHDLRYLASPPWLQVVWNFQAHHAAPFPEHDDQITETAWIAGPLLLVTGLQRALGYLADGPWRVWVVLLTLAHFVQSSHFLAHQRVHLGRSSLPPFVAKLQDAGLLLHPDVHRRHHETFDCNFCIFNGWANPIVNAGFRLAKRIGVVDPSVTLQVEPKKLS